LRVCDTDLSIPPSSSEEDSTHDLLPRLVGDGIYNTWGYVKPVPGTGVSVMGPFGTCLPTGVIDPVSRVPNRLNLLGSCDSTSGAGAY
jgi:hypothetical protein